MTVATHEGALPESKLIPVEEMRSLLHMGNSKLYEEMGSGRLKTVKVGQRRYTTQRFLNEYVAGLEAIALGETAA